MRANNRPDTARRKHRFTCDCGTRHETRAGRVDCDCGRQWRRRSSSGVRYDMVRDKARKEMVRVDCERCDGEGPITCNKCMGQGYQLVSRRVEVDSE